MCFRPDMPAWRPVKAIRGPLRIRIVLEGLRGDPGDTAWARRFRDVLAEILSDIETANVGLSEGQRQLARRCATIAIACARMEGVAAAGNEIDLVQYGTLTDRLGRAFQRLGLRRVPRNVGPLSRRSSSPALGPAPRMKASQRRERSCLGPGLVHADDLARTAGKSRRPRLRCRIRSLWARSSA